MSTEHGPTGHQHHHHEPVVVTSDEPAVPPVVIEGPDGQVQTLLGAAADGSGHASPDTGDGGSPAPAMSTPVPAATGVASVPTPANVADIEEAMRDVVDPELGINVVDLGLVYGITVDPQGHAVVDMTLTSAACPLTDVIEDQTAQALEGLVPTHRLNWVWMPPWGPDKITPDGREQLRALGFNV